MKVRILIGILLFLIALNLATIGSYVYLRFSHGHRKHSFSRERIDHKHRPDLHLNRDQRRQLFDLFRSFRMETDSQQQQIHELEGKTFSLLQHEPVLMDSVDANLKKIAELRYEISRHIIGKLLKAKSYLTPDQQQQFYKAIINARPELRRPQPPPPTTFPP